MFVEAAVLAYVCKQLYNMEGAYVYGRTRSSGEEEDVKERSDAGGFFYFPFSFSLRKKRKPGAWGNGHDSRF